MLGPDDDSDKESSDKEVEEVVVLSDDEPEVPEVEMVGQAVAVVEGDRELPIVVENISDVADPPIFVKQELEEVMPEEGTSKQKKKGGRGPSLRQCAARST